MTAVQLDNLIGQLGDKDWRIRRSAAMSLGDTGDAGAVDALVQALKDENWTIRCESLRSLAKIGDVRAADEFESVLDDRVSWVRFAALNAYRKFGGAVCAERLVLMTIDPYEYVKRIAMELWNSNVERLCDSGDGKTIDQLVRASVHSDETVCKAAEEALNKVAEKRGVHPFRQVGHMLTAVKDQNPSVRRLATEKLAVIDEVAASKAVAKALKDDDEGVVYSALEGLVRREELFALFDLVEMKAKSEGRRKQKVADAVERLKKAAEASLSLEDKRPVCRNCLARFVRNRVKTGFLQSVAFYGCRRCGRVQPRMEYVGKITAVLDSPWDESFYVDGGDLFVNLAMRDPEAHLAEFDELEIRNAPGVNLDEMVQLILRKSGNDACMSARRMTAVPVRLVGDPSLTQNSLNLIKIKTKGFAAERRDTL